MPIIEMRGLTKHYGREIGLDGVDLTVEPGEILGFLGPNGAGKTTAIRLLLDLIRPTRGTARLFGRDVADPGLRRRVGYLPGDLALDPRMTGLQMLVFLDRLQPGGASAARAGLELCERIGLDERDLRRGIREYSKGMKQKIGLVSAMQHDPDLLVLDEPTTGLDPLVRETLFEIMAERRRRGKTIFHSSHVLSEVDRTCTRVAVLRAGRLLRVMPVEEIRRASVRRMEIRFAGEAPWEALDLPGTERVRRDGSRVVLRVSGELDPLIAVLARHSVIDFSFPESSLEEAFVDLYRTDHEPAS